MLVISAIAAALLKKLLIQSLLNEETRKKLITVLICILVLLLVVIITVASFPSILINVLFNNTPTDIKVMEDEAKVAVYQDTIFIVDKLNQEWIEKVKEEYSDCDEFVVNYNYDLTWQALISIDSVLLKQDFKNMNPDKIIDNALKFLIRTVTVEEVEVEEDVGHNSNCSDDCELSHIELVTKKIATITIETRDFEEVLPDVDITTKSDTLLALNIYSTISGINVEGSFNIYDDIDVDDLQEYPEGSENLPYYNQTDKRWGTNTYGNTTILDGGCGPTALAMVVSGLTGNRVTPDMVAEWSVENGHRAEGLGSYWSLMIDGGNYYGLDVEAINKNNKNALINALKEGYPIIACMGKGHFTNRGHFIVLRGITEDGKILVYDSASVERSNKEWDLSIIINESSKNGKSPFWIFRP